MYWWEWLDVASFQSTDTFDPKRGHYWFKLPPGKRFGNLVFPWGEIRCDGGGLILWPTWHAKTSEHRRYLWIRQDDDLELPGVITDILEVYSAEESSPPGRCWCGH